jgi:nitrogen fixation-related uncharacterized protein
MQIQLEEMLLGVVIFWIAISILITAVGLWITYWLIKVAIRDGIKESGLVDAIRNQSEPERKPKWTEPSL